MALNKTRRADNPCPHCGHSGQVRTSKKVTETSREKYYRCTNQDCGYQWRSVESIVTSVRESRSPNPEVHIPFYEDIRPRAAPSG